MKILVVGIGRSGTTLTYRIVMSNPHIRRRNLLETCVLYRYKTPQRLLKVKPYFKEGHLPGVCEKINYTNRTIQKPKLGDLDISIVDYCEMWLDWFKDEARVVHIIRHPLDTIFSMFAKRGRALKSFTGFPDVDKVKTVPKSVRHKVLDKYFSISPEYPEAISKLPQTITFKYEDLILKSETLKNVFEFCNLPYREYPGQLKQTRVFGYKKTGFEINRPVDHVVDTFNKICDGVKYER